VSTATGANCVLLDPTSERSPATREPRARLDTLAGRTVGLLDISKPGGDVFLDRVATLLGQRGARVLRFRKPTFAKVAPVDLRKQIREQTDAVLEALAD
jgi:hypothetical protein